MIFININIYFEYKGLTIALPINPEELKISRPGNNENTEVVGLGEINIIKTKRLIPITIESFFPQDENPDEYINFFKTIQDDLRPVRIICKEFDLNLQVSIDGFDYSMRAGEEGDRYYTLELQEWRDYRPILVNKPEKVQQQGGQTQVPQPPKTEAKKDFQKGDTVKFNGGNHYHTSQDAKPTGKPRKPGNAQITLTAPGSKHPYHLIGTQGGSDVYGWVDEGSFTS